MLNQPIAASRGFIQEFKAFALKGSLIDLAVGIIIGTAFNAVVNSLVNDIIMPIFGKLIGNVDFNNLVIILSRQKFETLAAAQEAGVAIIRYGTFINEIVNFVIVALSIFVALKFVFRHVPEEKK
jgi:large conductance mechanosensitive channel